MAELNLGARLAPVRAAAGPWHSPFREGGAGTGHSKRRDHYPAGLIKPRERELSSKAACSPYQGADTNSPAGERLPLCCTCPVPGRADAVPPAPPAAAPQPTAPAGVDPVHGRAAVPSQGPGARGVPMSHRPSTLCYTTKFSSLGKFCADSAWHRGPMQSQPKLAGGAEEGPSQPFPPVAVLLPTSSRHAPTKPHLTTSGGCRSGQGAPITPPLRHPCPAGTTAGHS